MRVIGLIVFVALAASSCGAVETERVASAPVQAETHGARGVTVELPAGWQAAPSTLTPKLTDPREVLSVATYSLRYRETACAHMAGSALEDLGPGDAFITVQERGLDASSSWSGFPDRPARFGPQLGGPSEASACAPGADFADHWFGFSDGGRHFHVDVAFGPEASRDVRRQAWAILDGLRVDPAVRPDWPSAG